MLEHFHQWQERRTCAVGVLPAGMHDRVDFLLRRNELIYVQEGKKLWLVAFAEMQRDYPT